MPLVGVLTAAVLVPWDIVVPWLAPMPDSVQEQVDLRYLGGSMVATAQDVGVFVRAPNDGSLLTDDGQAFYSSIYEYGHTGWVPGYYGIARYHQDVDSVVVQFVNTTGGKALGLSNAIHGRIVRILRRP